MKVQNVMRLGVSAVTEDEDLALALQLMLWRGIRHLPVVREGRVVGILSERDILIQRDDSSGVPTVQGKVRDAMHSPAKTIDPDAELVEAAKRLSDYKVGCLPVVVDDDLVGIITTTDLLRVMVEHPEPPEEVGTLSAQDVMTSSVIAVMPDEPLVDAAATLVQHGFRHLPVIDGLKRIVGILSDRDIRQAIGNPMDSLEHESSSRRVRNMRVSDAMTPDPHTCLATESVSRVSAAMINDHIGAVPVVDEDGHLLGLVSYVDILRHVVTPQGERGASIP